MIKPEKLIHLAIILLTTFILFLASSLFLHTFDDYRATERMNRTSELSDDLVRLGETRALTRGRISGGIAGAEKGTPMQWTALDTLSSDIDTQWKQIKTDLLGTSELPNPEALSNSIQSTDAAYTELSELRARLEPCLKKGRACAVSSREWLTASTRLINQLAQIREELLMGLEAPHQTLHFNIAARRWAAVAAENAGLERGFLVYWVGRRQPVPPGIHDQLLHYRGIVNRTTEQLTHFAGRPNTDPRIQSAIKAMRQIFLVDFEILRRRVYTESASGNYSIDAETWLTQSTNAINSLIAISHVMAEVTSETSAQLRRQQQRHILLHMIPTAVALILGLFSLTWVRRIANEIFTQKELAEITLHSIGDAVMTTDASARVTYLNPTAEELTGWTNAQARNRPAQDIFKIIDAHSREGVAHPVEVCLREKRVANLGQPTLLIRADQLELAIEDSAAPILDRNGTAVGAVLVFYDVTQIRQTPRILSFQATHDTLTGLINRREFERTLEVLLASARAEQRQHALAYLDLDQFKLVNDICGHSVGDSLLCQITQLFRAACDEGWILARLGGDEFGLLIPDTSIESALAASQTLCSAVAQFHFGSTGHRFDIGVSIGIVAINSLSTTRAELLSQADAACFAAKDKGRNRVQLYQPDNMELIKRQQQMTWVSRINQAIEQERMVLYCQRVAPSNPDHLWHAEVLIRMQDESGTIIGPAEFLPAAERYGLMPKIDRWVIAAALRAMGTYLQSHPLDLICNINLSGASLTDELLSEYILQMLAIYQVPAASLCFEITETAAIENLEQAMRFMHTLREAGCRFALDDFGSGLSSFGYLRKLPVDYLKIDGGLVRDMIREPVNRAMVDAIASVGRVMGLQTVAEYVESDELWALVKESGIDFAQGYAIDRPQPITTCLQFQRPSGGTADTD